MDAYTANRDAVALAAATAKTVIQIVTPSTLRAVIRQLEISLDGVTAAAVPGLWELLVQTTAGTMSALTPAAHDIAAPASLVTAQHTATVEPTASTVIKSGRLSPYGGIIVLRFDGNEGIRLPVSTRVGLRLTYAAIVNVNAGISYEA